MTQVIDTIRARRSIRRFKRDPLAEGTVDRLLEAMSWAPSAGNAQPVRIHLVEDGRLRAELAAAAFGQGFLAEAPLVVVVAVDLDESRRAYGKRGVELYCLQDAAAAVQNLLLAACSLGLGTCWVGAFREEALVAALGLAPSERPVAIVPVGLPAETPPPPPRKSLALVARRYSPR